MDPNTEIRKLRPAELYTLARILASSDSWKTLMGVVPKEGTDNVSKFSTEHFALIEQASCQQRKSGAEIFLEEWSTMGKQRPTLKSTLDLLVKVQLFRAADYIAVDLLKMQPPKRPEFGPAAAVDISDEEIAKLMKRTISESDIPDSCFLASKESLDSVLDEIAYPSQLSVKVLPGHRQEEVPLRAGLEFVDQMSTLQISPGGMSQITSNLMKFSKSDAESLQSNIENFNSRNNSNLIQFSGDSIQNTKTTGLEENFISTSDMRVGHFSDNTKGVLPTQSIAGTNSTDNVEEHNSQKIIRGENIQVDSDGLKVWNNSDTNDISNGRSSTALISNSNNCNEQELQSSELPAFVADIGRDSIPVYDELKSSELPQFVAEIANHRTSQYNVKSFREPIISNSSTSSETSSNLFKVTTSSNSSTESNIPIFVNYPSANLENNELVSAELPQFVAELGHR